MSVVEATGTESFDTMPSEIVFSAALAPRREVPSLIPRSRSQPADIFLPGGVRGQPAALDVTIISTMQPATINGSASTQGHALLVGEARKLSTHEAACTAVGVSFVPIVMESLGGTSALAVITSRASVASYVNDWGFQQLTQFDTCSKGAPSQVWKGKCHHVVTPVSDLLSLHRWCFLTFYRCVWDGLVYTGIHLFIQRMTT